MFKNLNIKAYNFVLKYICYTPIWQQHGFHGIYRRNLIYEKYTKYSFRFISKLTPSVKLKHAMKCYISHGILFPIWNVLNKHKQIYRSFRKTEYRRKIFGCWIQSTCYSKCKLIIFLSHFNHVLGSHVINIMNWRLCGQSFLYFENL
jgi:hypothetical protein